MMRIGAAAFPFVLALLLTAPAGAHKGVTS